MNGITLEELEDWRVNTRRNLGVNSMVKNIMGVVKKANGKQKNKK